MFKPLRTDNSNAVAQCQKCKAVFSIDLVDVITGYPKVHKDPKDPRYVDTPCGGEVKLFQEVKLNAK